MTDEKAHRQSRDAVTGQYDFGDDFERLCKCGHTLGVHCAGGWDCFNGEAQVPGADGTPCDCQKFRPTGKRKTSAVQP